KLSSEKADDPAHSGDRPTTAPGDQQTRNLHLRGPMGVLIFGIFVVGVFLKPLFLLAAGAMQSQLDSYIVLVPFVSAYLVYDRRKRLPKEDGFSLWAMIPLVAGIIALTTALKLHRPGNSLSDHDYLALMALSFVGFLAAGGFFFLGRKWMTAAAFPVAFLIFIVPMPDAM